MSHRSLFLLAAATAGVGYVTAKSAWVATHRDATWDLLGLHVTSGTAQVLMSGGTVALMVCTVALVIGGLMSMSRPQTNR